MPIAERFIMTDRTDGLLELMCKFEIEGTTGNFGGIQGMSIEIEYGKLGDRLHTAFLLACLE